MAIDLALNPEDLGEGFEDEAEDLDEELSDAGQNQAKRNLEKIKKEVKDKAKKQVQKVVQKAASKATARTIAVAAGATVVGLIVTYLIWTGQAIFANWLGHDKIIPKLDWWELILWGILTLIIIALVISLLFLLVGVFIFSNPFTAAPIIGEMVWDIIAG